MRVQPWESAYAPGMRRAPSPRTMRRAAKRDLSILDLAEDGVPSHKVTEATLVMVPDDLWLTLLGTSAFRSFARQHRIRFVNIGVVPDGIAITFGSKKEAAKFRLLWDDPRWECKVPR